MVQLRFQARMAQALLKCGRDKIWLNPEMKGEISKVKTRDGIRGLISLGVIKRKPLRRYERPVQNKANQHHYLRSLKTYKRERVLRANLANPNYPTAEEEHERKLEWKAKKKRKYDAFLDRLAEKRRSQSPN
mmetsp:Transcript_31082/g.87116  ORF Transcript_31082/g.87116 Transcript_31082/m.87116 type:complete len:132 (+) Transcript_31082:82-477(+)